MSTEIYAALSKAQAEFPAIVKDGYNPHFKSKFATLGAIKDAVTPVLRANGLHVQQAVHNNDLLTIVRHLESATFVQSVLPLGEHADLQKLGSAITYARRYALVTILDLVTEDDDDGNAAVPLLADTGNKAAQATPVPATRPVLPEGWFSDEDCVQAHNILADRIARLPEAGIEQCRAYREKNGWPMDAEGLKILEEQVSRIETEAEQVTADTVQKAFPGAEAEK